MRGRNRTSFARPNLQLAQPNTAIASASGLTPPTSRWWRPPTLIHYAPAATQGGYPAEQCRGPTMSTPGERDASLQLLATGRVMAGR